MSDAESVDCALHYVCGAAVLSSGSTASAALLLLKNSNAEAMLETISTKILLLIVAALSVASVCSTADNFMASSCYIPPEKPIPPLIKSPQPHTYLLPESVPSAFDWRNISGRNFCSSSRNQHIPQWCGSCWAMASSSALSDRIRIARKGKFPDYMIAVQTLVYCCPFGCHGGAAEVAHLYIYLHGIGTDPCQNYVALGSGLECTAEHTCENCDPDKGCWPVTRYPKFGVKEFGDVLGVQKMKAEIFARGPIACYVNSHPIHAWGLGPDAKGIFDGCPGSKAGCTTMNHVVSVVGFGYDMGRNMSYWVVRNSWGEYWGDNGFFRLKMGDDQIGIEGHLCAWAVPEIPPELL